MKIKQCENSTPSRANQDSATRTQSELINRGKRSLTSKEGVIYTENPITRSQARGAERSKTKRCQGRKKSIRWSLYKGKWLCIQSPCPCEKYTEWNYILAQVPGRVESCSEHPGDMDIKDYKLHYISEWDPSQVEQTGDPVNRSKQNCLELCKLGICDWMVENKVQLRVDSVRSRENEWSESGGQCCANCAWMIQKLHSFSERVQ